MNRRLLGASAFVLALTACSFPRLPRLASEDAGADAVQAHTDAAPDATQCFGSYVRVCLSSLPSAPVSVVDQDLDINTDAGANASPRCDSQITDYCVIAGTSFAIGASRKLVAHGSRPLILVSMSTFAVSGDIDVASHVSPVSKGPGADAVVCAVGTLLSSVGGGYGGSFGGKGGNGSAGKSSGGPVGGGGTAADGVSRFPPMLRGGCPGGAGGLAGTGGEGSGGSGGGAIAIIATSISLDGRINASGAGGRGGSAPANGGSTGGGGGGGGSGGMVLLDSTMVSFASSRAKIWANGGGGAQGGASNVPAVNGNESTAPNAGALESSGTGNGANGGAGSIGDTLTGTTGLDDARAGGGGGGGGGGAGVIHAEGASSATVVSPLSLPLPSV